MDNTLLLALVITGIFVVGIIVGVVLGWLRQRPGQQEVQQLRLALQQSRNEVQQRDEVLQRSQKDLHRTREELEQLQEELQRSQQDLLHSHTESQRYRTHVTQHFTQTADLLQALTLDYRAVYEHLAAGAEALCDGQVKTLTPETLRERLLASPNEGTHTGDTAPQSLATDPDAEPHPGSSAPDTRSDERL